MFLMELIKIKIQKEFLFLIFLNLLLDKVCGVVYGNSEVLVSIVRPRVDDGLRGGNKKGVGFRDMMKKGRNGCVSSRGEREVVVRLEGIKDGN